MMAVSCFYVKPIFKKIQEDLFSKALGFVRHKSRSNPRIADRGRPSRFGLKRNDNSFVQKSTLLYNQHKLSFCPGLNVGIGPISKLYAKVPGRVLVSCEKTNFNPDSYFMYSMATQLPITGRTQGDGMEKIDNDSFTEQIIVLQPQEIEGAAVGNGTVEKTSVNKNVVKNLGLAIKLTPQAVIQRKKDILSSLKNKEPKFVPYEPYKAAVRPIIPQIKKTTVKHRVKKKKDFVSIFNSDKRENFVKVNDEVEKLKESYENLEVDWEAKYKGLESEVQTLREENKQLENQLKFQVQVNGELKNLLVAAVGEDMETKVHVLTEDKLHLAQALLKSAESLSTHQEQTEWLAGQCEVWRSKFLASSVMVEELARWKASLCQKVNEAHETLKKFLEDGKQMRDSILKTHTNLCLLRDNFDLHSKKKNLNGCNVIDVCAENITLTEILILELLGSEKKFAHTSTSCMDHLKKTSAEKSAEQILSNPNVLQLIGEPDAACNAVVGAAVTLSSQLYLQNHPPKIECCPQCSGEIKLI